MFSPTAVPKISQLKRLSDVITDLGDDVDHLTRPPAPRPLEIPKSPARGRSTPSFKDLKSPFWDKYASLARSTKSANRRTPKSSLLDRFTTPSTAPSIPTPTEDAASSKAVLSALKALQAKIQTLTKEKDDMWAKHREETSRLHGELAEYKMKYQECKQKLRSNDRKANIVKMARGSPNAKKALEEIQRLRIEKATIQSNYNALTREKKTKRAPRITVTAMTPTPPQEEEKLTVFEHRIHELQTAVQGMSKEIEKENAEKAQLQVKNETNRELIGQLIKELRRKHTTKRKVKTVGKTRRKVKSKKKKKNQNAIFWSPAGYRLGRSRKMKSKTKKAKVQFYK